MRQQRKKWANSTSISFFIPPINWGERSESLPSLQRCNFVCISTTSRLYIGLAVRLYVFINISLFSLMFKLLYLCRERPDQESN